MRSVNLLSLDIKRIWDCKGLVITDSRRTWFIVGRLLLRSNSRIQLLIILYKTMSSTTRCTTNNALVILRISSSMIDTTIIKWCWIKDIWIITTIRLKVGECNHQAGTEVDRTATEAPWNLRAIKNSSWKTWCSKKNSSITRNDTCFVNNSSVLNNFVRSSIEITYGATRSSSITIKTSIWLSPLDNSNQREPKKSLRFKDFRNIVKDNKRRCSKCKKSYSRSEACSSSNQWCSSRARMANSSTSTSSTISLNVTIPDNFLKAKNSSRTKTRMKSKE